MFKLDNDFLTSLGLGGLPVDEKNKLLQHIYETLEMRVGMRLAEKMTDAQLDEFESYIDRNDEPGALRWLESNFPNYKDVVAEELEKLKNEVSASAPQILAAAQAAAAQGGQPQVQQGAPQGAPQQQMPQGGSQGNPQQPQGYGQPMGGQPDAYAPAPQHSQQPFTPQPSPFGAQPQMQPQQQPQPQRAPAYSQPAPSFQPQANEMSDATTGPAAPDDQPLMPMPMADSGIPAADPYAPAPQLPQQPPQQTMPQPAPGFGPPPFPSQQGNGQQQFTPPPPGFTPGQ